MDKYIDEQYTVLDETLICCKNTCEDLVIPDNIDGHLIKRIGAGCYINRNTRTLKLSEGIESIGTKAFLSCSQLRKVELPTSIKNFEEQIFNGIWTTPGSVVYLNRKLSLNDYDKIKAREIVLTDGRRLLGDCRDIEALKGIYTAFSALKPPAVLTKSMKQLVLERSHDKSDIMNIREDSLYDNTGLIKDAASEKEHDDLLRRKRPAQKNILLLMHYRDSEVRQADGCINICFHLPYGCLYFPVKQRVVYGGKDYYVPSKMYINQEGRHLFYAEDMLDKICDADGATVDAEKRTAIAAKFRLLSMIS